ncbi:hypothetical protein JRO89_XS07G0281400 [Xanthoceras sorbifolium]|uniref:Uncharacterized protein n=1 Tax=Xanthoceras sorbifolium TaxID=99658 RepID=A0ABQ8HVR8_9ROSI|nr:hypothetical protein JRO89_XS07G0281400 [Xanthoceras sorbifolium]
MEESMISLSASEVKTSETVLEVISVKLCLAKKLTSSLMPNLTEATLSKAIEDSRISELIPEMQENKINMHDLLPEMCWEIVSQESSNNPGQRSWSGKPC